MGLFVISWGEGVGVTVDPPTLLTQASIVQVDCLNMAFTEKVERLTEKCTLVCHKESNYYSKANLFCGSQLVKQLTHTKSHSAKITSINCSITDGFYFLVVSSPQHQLNHLTMNF